MKSKDKNDIISKRFDAYAKSGDHTEMYAAKAEYDENLRDQKNELEDMRDKNSPEYRQKKEEIEKQEERSKEMSREIDKQYKKEHGYNDQNAKKEDLEKLKRENQGISREMHRAVEKGDTKKFDALSQKYETNIKAQEGISKELKTNGIDHEDTSYRQRVDLKNQNNDMSDKLRASSKPKDRENAQKYMNRTRECEQKELKKKDNAELDRMKNNYGLSEEEINAERKKMEHEREKYR
ncbi:MAG: hypothetical protein IKJ35_05510 [Clostridia bacterium]|nr:hypothetical protein [Clostridia bacterium]